MPIARILAGLTARSRSGLQETATSSSASATTSGSVLGSEVDPVEQVEDHDGDRELGAGHRGQHGRVAPRRVPRDQ